MVEYLSPDKVKALGLEDPSPYLNEGQVKALGLDNNTVIPNPEQSSAGRYANIAKQSFDKSISGLLGMPGDINNWLNKQLGGIGSGDIPVKGILPDTNQIYDTLFKPPVPKVTPQTTGEEVVSFASGFAPDLLVAGKAPITQSPKFARLAETLYKTGIKTPSALTPIERTKQIRTLINERIPYTEKGAQKLLDLKAQAGKEIENIVSSGSTVSNTRAGNIADEIEKLKGRYSTSLYRDEIYSAFDDIKNRVVNVWGGGNPFTLISPQKLQQLKTDLYKMNEKAYGKDVLEMTAREAAMKQAGVAAKEGIEKSIPGVIPANKRFGDLADVEDNLLRAAGREANKEPLSALDFLASGGNIGSGGLQSAIAFRAARTAGVRSKAAFGADALSKSKSPDYIRNLILLEIMKGRPTTGME